METPLAMDPEWTDGFQPCAEDPTLRTRACCWQRFVVKFLITYIRVSLHFLANLDAEDLEHIKRLEGNRDVELEEMD